MTDVHTWPTRPSTASIWTRRAVVGVTVQAASAGDPATRSTTLIMAAEQVEAVQPGGPSVKELARDQAYHSDDTLVALKGVRVRTYHLCETGRLPGGVERPFARNRETVGARPSPDVCKDCSSTRPAATSGCSCAT